MLSASAFLLFLKPYLWAFVVAFGSSFINEYLKRKALADQGAQEQRSAQDRENARTAAQAALTAGQVNAETDAQFGADAGAWR